MPETTPAHREPLTRNQLQILERVASGKRMCAIATDLDVSLGYVETTMRQVRDRLIAETTPHAVAIAYETGVLPIAGGSHG